MTSNAATIISNLATPENVKIFFIMLANIGCVVGVVSANKMIYRQGFQLPSSLMAFHFCCTWMFVLGAKYAGVFESKFVGFKVYALQGLSMAAAVGFVNLSLVHNTVGTYQLLKFLAILVTCVVEFVWKRKTYDFAVYVALSLLVLGVSLATVSQVELTATGLCFGLFGALFVSVYQVYNKAVQADHKVSALQLLQYEQPSSAYWCMMLAFATDKFDTVATLNWTPQLIGLLLVSGVCAFGVNLSSFLIIGKTSPITYNVVGHAKTLLLFLVSFVAFEESMNTKQLLGLVIAVAAIMWYTQLTTAAPAKSSATSDPQARARDALLEVPLDAEFQKLPQSTRLCAAKMKLTGASTAQIAAFVRSHQLVLNGERGIIPEAIIEPPRGLPSLNDVYAQYPTENVALLSKTVVLKLNGGLGTTMGLDRAKSLVFLKNHQTFLDIMALQVRYLRKRHGSALKFMLLNSFSTSNDTKNYLDLRYSADFPASQFTSMEIMQSKAPKICADTFEPAFHPANADLEWCPPGHGELWSALGSSGRLDELLRDGYEYMFVSNSDNLGATLDLQLLSKFATEKLDMMVEVAERTQSDVKGSHLAKYSGTGRLLVRELAQTDSADQPAFFNIQKHCLFNTNNIWMNLNALKQKLVENGGILPLPVVRNPKTVDPIDPKSAAVLQLECAVGTAIQLFERTAAVVVPRSRFSPVKMCNDLLAVRSDCFEMRADGAISLIPERRGLPPTIVLDAAHFQRLDQFEEMMNDTIPSMKNCTSLSVSGPLQFSPGVVFEGDVKLINRKNSRVTLPPGKYTGTNVLA